MKTIPKNIIFLMYKFSKKVNTLIKFIILGGVNMRRERRHERNENSKNILYIGGSILGIGIIAFVITFIVYGNIMEEQSDFSSGKISSLVEATNNAKTANSGMGKTVEESKEELEKTQTEPINITDTNISSKTNDVKKETTKKETTTTKPVNEKKEVSFIKPIDGEIAKQYAKDNLLYSQTLEEWTTHLGIDIKADKATVVKASADGKVKSIKNDPRYGLSVIVEHEDGYETLYSNLLTSEFVEVGETIKQGQSIGTVGNTAPFEILDDAHLHFEISKNGEVLDPNQFIK